jgi:hypothetical protein
MDKPAFSTKKYKKGDLHSSVWPRAGGRDIERPF